MSACLARRRVQRFAGVAHPFSCYSGEGGRWAMGRLSGQVGMSSAALPVC